MMLNVLHFRSSRPGLWRKQGLICLAILLALLPFGAALASQGQGLVLKAPAQLRPYAQSELQLEIPLAGSLDIVARMGGVDYPLVQALPVQAGEVSLPLNGLSLLGEPLPKGKASLVVSLQAKDQQLETRADVNVQTPAAGVLYALASRESLPVSGGDDLYVDYQLSRPGWLYVHLAKADAPETALHSWTLEGKGTQPRAFRWNRSIKGQPAPAGDYLLSFQMKGSQQQPLTCQVRLTEQANQSPSLALSQPGSFLPQSMDEASIWAAMMAPITVVDIGSMSHQHVYEQASTSSPRLGAVHGQTAGLEILELNVQGFAKVRAARHGDGQWITGYLPQDKLKVLHPDSRYGVLIDKENQTLTVYREGKALGSLQVSTGIYVPPGKSSFETIAGAFLTQDRIEDFNSEGYRYLYTMRIDGGNMIHSAGFRQHSGLRDFSQHLADLGAKATHGCVRVDPRPTAENLNAWWLFANLPRGTKVLVLPEDAQKQAVLATDVLGTGEPGISQEESDAAAQETPEDLMEDAVEQLAEAPVQIPESPDFQVLDEETLRKLEAQRPPKFSRVSPSGKTRVVLTFGGDCILGSEERTRKKPESFDSKVELEGFSWPFSGLKDYLLQDDLSLVNLENVLKDNNNGLVYRQHNFRGPTAFVDVLKQGGIDLVNLANNHFVDYGQEGKNSTRRALEEAGIPYAGYGSLYIFEKQGIRIGFGGIRETIFLQNRQRIAEEIRQLKQEGCHYIVYTCHFGTEYQKNHNQLQTQMAHLAIEAGANLVIGHHTHVVQGIEEYQGGLIFYSLGNLVFGGNLDLSTFDGLVAQVALDFVGDNLEKTQVLLLPVLTSGDRPRNDFRPVLAQGEDKARILQTIHADSEKQYKEHFVLQQGQADTSE